MAFPGLAHSLLKARPAPAGTASSALTRWYYGGLDLSGLGFAAFNMKTDIEQENYAGVLEIGAVSAYYLTDLFEARVRENALYDRSLIILSFTMYTIHTLNLQNGMPDDRGEVFDDGAAKFRMAGQTLGEAISPDGWGGRASEAYSGQLDKLRALAQAMEGVDQGMREVLATEAGQLEETRRLMAHTAYALALAMPAALLLYQQPGGWWLSRVFQLAVALAALGVAVKAMSSMGIRASDNAQEVERLAVRYRQVLNKLNSLNMSPFFSGPGGTLASVTGAVRPNAVSASGDIGTGIAAPSNSLPPAAASTMSAAEPTVASESQSVPANLLASEIRTAGTQAAWARAGHAGRTPRTQPGTAEARSQNRESVLVGATSGESDIERAPTEIQAALVAPGEKTNTVERGDPWHI